MCRLAELRDNLIPIIKNLLKSRRFGESIPFTIGDPENNEQLSLLLREDNQRNENTAIILFEQINLKIRGKDALLDFQIMLKLGNDNHISFYDLELLLLPDQILKEYTEEDIAKEVISCWNAELE